jgi:hypothetical protein
LRRRCPRARFGSKSITIEPCTAARDQAGARSGSLSTLQSSSMKVTYAAEALGDAAQVLSFVADQSTVARVRRCNSHRHGGEGLVPLTGVCVARKAACQWPGFGSLRNMGCGELVSERRCKCHVAGKQKATVRRLADGIGEACNESLRAAYLFTRRQFAGHSLNVSRGCQMSERPGW